MTDSEKPKSVMALIIRTAEATQELAGVDKLIRNYSANIQKVKKVAEDLNIKNYIFSSFNLEINHPESTWGSLREKFGTGFYHVHTSTFLLCENHKERDVFKKALRKAKLCDDFFDVEEGFKQAYEIPDESYDSYITFYYSKEKAGFEYHKTFFEEASAVNAQIYNLAKELNLHTLNDINRFTSYYHSETDEYSFGTQIEYRINDTETALKLLKHVKTKLNAEFCLKIDSSDIAKIG